MQLRCRMVLMETPAYESESRPTSPHSHHEKRNTMKIYVDESQPEPMLVTAKHAAHLICISERHLYSLTQRGELKAVRIGRKKLYRMVDIQRFVEERCS
jgi:excisionase family DNA binding protein